ncbi:MAG: 6-phosphogluconolactonase, partial [Bacteroidales bacterium]|nr:6-phosphogluconolactonase [Bacteroidales bacterium]
MNPSEKLTSLLIQAIKKKIATKPNSRFLLAISGGTSPLSLFRLWTGRYRNKIDWNNIELFWVDERCVPPDDSESNYGTARKMLLDNVPIPETRVHRIKGEE